MSGLEIEAEGGIDAAESGTDDKGAPRPVDTGIDTIIDTRWRI